MLTVSNKGRKMTGICREFGLNCTGYDKLVKLVIVSLYFFLGCMFYMNNMNWTVIEALYFISVSVTTTGYGQLHCTHNSCKLFTIPYILLGVAICLTICNEFAKEVVIKCQEIIILQFYHHVLRKTTVPLRRMRQIKMFLSIFGVFLTLFSGALFYSQNEGWSFLNGFYWVSETITSVGYGDLTIKYESSRLFGIFYVLCGCVMYATSINCLFDLYYQVSARTDDMPDEDDDEKVDEVELLLKKNVSYKLTQMKYDDFRTKLLNGITKFKDRKTFNAKNRDHHETDPNNRNKPKYTDSFSKILYNALEMERNNPFTPQHDMDNIMITSDVLFQQTLIVSGLINYELDVVPVVDSINEVINEREPRRTRDLPFDDKEIEKFIEKLHHHSRALTKYRRTAIQMDAQGKISMKPMMKKTDKSAEEEDSKDAQNSQSSKSGSKKEDVFGLLMPSLLDYRRSMYIPSTPPSGNSNSNNEYVPLGQSVNNPVNATDKFDAV